MNHFDWASFVAAGTVNSACAVGFAPACTPGAATAAAWVGREAAEEVHATSPLERALVGLAAGAAVGLAAGALYALITRR